MALIKPAGPVSQASGKTGGTVYARNRGGPYARNWAKPISPSTDAQITARANLSYAAIAWRTILNGPQRLAWNNYAAVTPVTNRLGDSRLLSGFNWFAATMTFISAVNGSPPGTVPQAPIGPGLTPAFQPGTGAHVITGDTTSDPMLMNLAGGTYPNGDEDLWELWISPMLSPGISFFKGPWKLFYSGPTPATVGGIESSTGLTSSDYPEGSTVFIAGRMAANEIDNAHFRMMRSKFIYGPYVVEAAP